jgi:hypothetical protein
MAEVGELWDPINWASWWVIYSKGRPLIGFLVCTMDVWAPELADTSIRLQEGTLLTMFVELSSCCLKALIRSQVSCIVLQEYRGYKFMMY